MPDTPKIGREPNDFYRTPSKCTEALLRVEQFPAEIWEPACGDGAISTVLEAAGHDVFSTDLIDRGFGEPGVDFLAQRDLALPVIVTNPPYKLAEAFLLHALSLGARKVAMLLRLAWLEGESRRRRVFSKHPPARIWVFSARPTLWHGTDPNARSSGGATAYAWFVWDSEAPQGVSVVGWLPKAAP
jgi:hypothetical protein